MKHCRVFLAIVAAMSTSHVLALESNGYTTENGLTIIPILESGLRYNDNYTRTSDAQSSTIFDVKPGVAIESDRNGNRYRVAYQLDAGFHSNTSDDNYVDHTFATNNLVRFTTRHALGFNYAFLTQHDARGSGIASGDALVANLTTPVEYKTHVADATYIFGSDNAKGRIEATLDFEDRTYTNYRGSDVLDTTFEDYQQIGADGAFYVQVLPATQLLFQLDYNNRQYTKNSRSGDSQNYNEIYYLTGAVWDITGKTNGKLRLGIQDKKYDDSSREGSDNFSWDLTVEWQPLEYSTITIDGGLRNEDADTEEGDLDASRISAQWKHYWLANIYSNLGLSYSRKDYNSVTRTDDTSSASIKLGYELYERVDLVAGWRGEDNDSNSVGYTYNQNVWSLNANFAF
ncbi:outer membrane beta-barrel protein [Vibrio ulleungensis]|uniref:Outer membrane beta-barrel protein n=1 Tax=Vibrio ulleungensis TaxID=2807619 RepID=A0ABS2HGV6_9VIBR|nr:outer membrane beta-barrel protein [Vibrio ulleungensis]MBM7036279.1 outer membrane beta-barrel protein [Vibrio ulleungensis]